MKSHRLGYISPFSVLLLIAIALSGCALTPQQTNIDPEINVTGVNIGNGRAIALRVDDERPTKSIGRRGTGAMSGAEIVPTTDVGVVFHSEIADGLKKRGFDVVAFSEEIPLRMIVELRELRYSTSMGFWTGGVHMSAAMKVEAYQGNEDYEEFYRDEEEQRVFFVNFADENDAIINAAASHLIQQLFDDNEIMEFLGK